MANVLAATKDMERDEWLQLRRLGVGGSDVAPICNLSKYKSKMEVYLEKLGELPPKEDNPKMKAGRMLEPLIADWFEEETGIKVRRRNAILQHPHHPFMLANIDRWVTGMNEGLEIKNTSEYNKQEWENEKVPTEYMLQCNHYMAVTGAQRWYVAVLIGGWDFQWRVIERDNELIENLITVEHNFWHDHVLPKVPPGFSGHDTNLLTTMYPDSRPDTNIELGEEHYNLIRYVRDSKAQLERAKYNFEDAKNQVKGIMEDCEVAWFQGERVFTWKSNKKGVRQFKILGDE